MAAELRKEPGLDVQLVDGNHGEFSVLVDGKKVAEKHDDTFPSPEEIKAAIHKAAPQPAGAAR